MKQTQSDDLEERSGLILEEKDLNTHPVRAKADDSDGTDGETADDDGTDGDETDGDATDGDGTDGDGTDGDSAPGKKL
jgi:hypothetical protein